MIPKQKKTFKWYIENRVLSVYLVMLIFYFMYLGIPILTYGINQTLSWKWMLMSTDFILTYYTLILYFLGLLILLIFKRKTNKLFSKLFLLSLLVIFLYDSIYGFNYMIVLHFKLFTLVLFLILFFSSLLKRK